MGAVAGAVEVLEQVIAPLGATTIVPGHGEVSGPELVDDVLGYLRFVLDVARRGQEAGLAPLAAARETDLGPYAHWHDPERIVGNLHRAYAELDGAERGAPLDLAAALGEMVSYNGGQPLTCLA
jgi:cyclase